MNAKKCDRCGRFYEQYSRVKDCKWHGADLSVVGDTGAYSSVKYDLCPVCAKDLVNFMIAYEDIKFRSDGKD